AYIVVFSAIILHERVPLFCWMAVAFGIMGALLIVKPAFAQWNVVYLIAVLGTSLNGLAFVLNKYLQHEGDSGLTTMFYANVVAVACNLPAVITADQLVTETWFWLSGVILFGPVGMYLGIVAVRYANASTLAPYTLLRLVIGVMGGIFVFHEMPDLLSSL